jgi:acyl-CoA thioester hydrolase
MQGRRGREVEPHLCNMENFRTDGGQTRHVHSLRVRYADTDRMDMVYHGTYAAYLEAARVEMLRDAGWVYSELEKQGTLLPVVQLNLTFKKPARYDQVLEIHTVVTHPLTTKLQLRCEVRHGEDLLVVGEVVLVFVDAASGRPCRPPVGMSDRLIELGVLHDDGDSGACGT